MLDFNVVDIDSAGSRTGMGTYRKVSMQNNMPEMNISGLISLVSRLRAGEPIELSDGTVVLSGKLKIEQILPKLKSTTVKETLILADKQAEQDDEVSGEPKKRYRRLRRGKHPNRYVQPWHYKAREQMGIFSRQDIKGFPLEKFSAFSRTDLKDLAELDIKTLDHLTGTSVAGLRYRIQKLHGSVSPSMFNRLLGSIKRAFDPIGLKYPNVHPHNENKDGSPKTV